MNLYRYGAALSAIYCSVAMADFSNLSITASDNTLTDGTNVVVIKLYSSHTSNNDQINAVAGVPASGNIPAKQLEIKAIDGNTLYQSKFGGDTSLSINPAFFPAFPDLMLDSWMTIGYEDSAGNGLIVAGDLAQTSDGNGFAANDGAIVGTPKESGVYGSEVLLAQLTLINDGSLNAASMQLRSIGENGNKIEGTIGTLQGKDQYGTTWEIENLEFGIGFELTDCNENGISDPDELGAKTDCDGNGILDECELNSDPNSKGYNDCNFNGILDVCEPADGDCNSNGIPDVCEGLADCNQNGVADTCEINDLNDCDNNGTLDTCEIDSSNDCDGNNVLDICEIDSETDCDNNGILDICELDNSNDCDSNGVLDNCELLDGDGNGDGILDACQSYINIDMGTYFDNAEDCIADAESGNRILASADAVNEEERIDFDGMNLTMDVNGSFAFEGSMTMAGGARLELEGPEAGFSGSLSSGDDGTATVSASGSLVLGLDSQMDVRSDATLQLECQALDMNGTTFIRRNGELDLRNAGNGNVVNSGNMFSLGDSTVVANTLINAGSLSTAGNYICDLNNTGSLKVNDETILFGDLSNDDLVSVNRGPLYVFGSITNNGQIYGEVDNGPARNAGGSFDIGESYIAGPNSSINLPDSNWTLSVGGDFDVAITDSNDFNMQNSTLVMTGQAGGDRTFEAMAADRGASVSEFESEDFAIGKIVIKSSASIRLVDLRANGHDSDAAIYVQSLVIEPGAELITDGTFVYYGDASIKGSIDDMGFVTPIVVCEADLTGDGLVDTLDLLAVISNYGSSNPEGDANADGNVDTLDLLAIISGFGSC